MKISKKIFFSLFTTVLMLNVSHAQQLPLYSQYYFNSFLYNPAKTGFDDNVNAYLIHRSQWRDIPGAPVTNALTIDGPVKDKKVGLGLTLYNDVQDFTNKIGVYSSYSYRLDINDDQKVNFGLSLGVIDTRIDYTQVIVKDVNDPFLLNQSQRRAAVDANFGAMYFYKKLEAGFSIPQLLGNSLKFGDDNQASYKLTRGYIFSTKYSFDIIKEKEFSVDPLIMLRYTPNTPLQYDISTIFNWQNIGWLGFSYRSNYAIGINARVKLYKSLSAGYAYDIITGPMKSYSGTSHEILLGYTFGSRGSKNDEVVQPQSALVDSLMNELQTTTDINAMEIKKLKDEVEKLKAEKVAVAIPAATDSGGFMRTGSAKDFKDQNNVEMKAGHYVVVGSFKNKENAEKARQKYLIKGYIESNIMLNSLNGFHYVYALKAETQEKASEILQKVRADEAPDSWVLSLE